MKKLNFWNKWQNKTWQKFFADLEPGSDYEDHFFLGLRRSGLIMIPIILIIWIIFLISSANLISSTKTDLKNEIEELKCETIEFGNALDRLKEKIGDSHDKIFDRITDLISDAEQRLEYSILKNRHNQ